MEAGDLPPSEPDLIDLSPFDTVARSLEARRVALGQQENRLLASLAGRIEEQAQELLKADWEAVQPHVDALLSVVTKHRQAFTDLKRALRARENSDPNVRMESQSRPSNRIGLPPTLVDLVERRDWTTPRPMPAMDPGRVQMVGIGEQTPQGRTLGATRVDGIGSPPDMTTPNRTRSPFPQI